MRAYERPLIISWICLVLYPRLRIASRPVLKESFFTALERGERRESKDGVQLCKCVAFCEPDKVYNQPQREVYHQADSHGV